jgi:hypothetical protein
MRGRIMLPNGIFHGCVVVVVEYASFTTAIDTPKLPIIFAFYTFVCLFVCLLKKRKFLLLR